LVARVGLVMSLLRSAAQADLLTAGQRLQLVAQPRRGGDDHLMQRVDCCGAGAHRAPPGHKDHSDRFHDTGVGFRDCGGHPIQGCSGGGFGVDRVGLSAGPADGPVGPVHLDQPHPAVGQGRGQPGAVGAGAFHSDPGQRALTCQPAEQLPITRGGRGETLVAQHRAKMANRGDGMGISMGVDTAEHQRRLHSRARVG
jgi:hypothetical protein